jgi:hypothetical protein
MGAKSPPFAPGSPVTLGNSDNVSRLFLITHLSLSIHAFSVGYQTVAWSHSVDAVELGKKKAMEQASHRHFHEMTGR